MDGLFNLMKISPHEILSGVGFVVGGVFLIAPGIFSDILGVCILIASFYCVTSDVPKFNASSENSEKSERKFWRRKAHGDDIINVEVIEENEIEIRKSIGEEK
ncbi:MAG: FxsA family protein [Campylobacter sp.]